MKKILLLAFTVLLTASMIFAQAADEKVASFPTKNIEWVVPIGAGQPVDRHVRALDNIIDFGTTTSVINMAGGGQANIPGKRYKRFDKNKR